MNYILGLLGLGLMIIVHELGHFIMAKIHGVRVVRFSIGFGPKILSHKGKETEYSLSLLPVGGFVQMLGSNDFDEENEDEEIIEEDESRYFKNKSPLQRFSIIIAGPLMNVILAIFLFSAVYTHFGFADTVLGVVEQNSPASEAGLEVGDKIIGIDGGKVFTTEDITIALGSNKGEDITVEVDRNGDKIEKKLKPEYVENEKRYKLGIGFDGVKNPTFFQGMKHSFDETATIVQNNYKVLGNLLKGKGDVKTDVGGPVSIIKVSSSAAKSGLWSLTYLIAIMSAGLGVVNLLPLPVLDGGNCILILIELITRRKVPDKIVNILNTIGFVLLFAVMVLVTIKDIIFPMT